MMLLTDLRTYNVITIMYMFVFWMHLSSLPYLRFRIPYVLRFSGSVGRQEHWLWDTDRKRNAILLCFLLFWESFIWYSFGTTGPIQVGFSAKCVLPNEDFNQIEIWKCDMFDFRLIPLDRITCKASIDIVCKVQGLSKS